MFGERKTGMTFKAMTDNQTGARRIQICPESGAPPDDQNQRPREPE